MTERPKGTTLSVFHRVAAGVLSPEEGARLLIAARADEQAVTRAIAMLALGLASVALMLEIAARFGA